MNKIIEILEKENETGKIVPPLYFKLDESLPSPSVPIFYCDKTDGALQVEKHYHKHLSRMVPWQ